MPHGATCDAVHCGAPQPHTPGISTSWAWLWTRCAADAETTRETLEKDKTRRRHDVDGTWTGRGWDVDGNQVGAFVLDLGRRITLPSCLDLRMACLLHSSCCPDANVVCFPCSCGTESI